MNMALNIPEYIEQRDALYAELFTLTAKPIRTKARDTIYQWSRGTIIIFSLLFYGLMVFLLTYYLGTGWLMISGTILLFFCIFIFYYLIENLVLFNKSQRKSYEYLNGHRESFEEDFLKHPMAERWLNHPQFRDAILRLLMQQETFGMRELYLLTDYFEQYRTIFQRLEAYDLSSVKTEDRMAFYAFQNQERRPFNYSNQPKELACGWEQLKDEIKAKREHRDLHTQTPLISSGSPLSVTRL